MDIGLVSRLQHRIKVLEKEKKLLQLEVQQPDNFNERVNLGEEGEKEIYDTIKVVFSYLELSLLYVF